MKKILIQFALMALVFIALLGCVGQPEGVTPVQSFKLDRYLGRWYEIARLDHSFERGLNNVTATYSMRTDGGVKVINRGYSVEKQQWQEAEGKAFFVNETDEGFFKVSFFGPFYGAYIIFELDDEGYQYSFVSGPDKSYLWLLSRTPNPPQPVIDAFVNKAKLLGFDTSGLIFVEHTVSTNQF